LSSSLVAVSAPTRPAPTIKVGLARSPWRRAICCVQSKATRPAARYTALKANSRSDWPARSSTSPGRRIRRVSSVIEASTTAVTTRLRLSSIDMRSRQS
jgi:hypothetical protein